METKEGTSQLGANPTQDGVSCENPDPEAQGPVGTWCWWEAGPQRPCRLHRAAHMGPVVRGLQVPAQSQAGEEPCVSAEPFPQAVRPHGGAAHGGLSPRSPPTGRPASLPSSCVLISTRRGGPHTPLWEHRAGPSSGRAGGTLPAPWMAALHWEETHTPRTQIPNGFLGGEGV